MIKTYVVDYDSTLELAEGQPNTALIAALNASGTRIIVWTSRDWLYYDYVKHNLTTWGLRYESIYCGKPLGDLYIDDRVKHWRDYLAE